MAEHAVSSDEQRRFLEAFIGAAQRETLAGVEGLFAEDLVPYSDDRIVRGALAVFWPRTKWRL
jgi:hypothetical protein